MKDLLSTILDGSLDAGLLVGGNGKVWHANAAAQDLFDLSPIQQQQQQQQQEENHDSKTSSSAAAAASQLVVTMDQLIKVWKHSLRQHKDNNDNDNDNKNKTRTNKKHARIQTTDSTREQQQQQQQQQQEDVLSWSDIVAYYDGTTTNDKNKSALVEEWTITGTKQQWQQQQQQEQQPPPSFTLSSKLEPTTLPTPPPTPIPPIPRETFPGVMKLTRLVDPQQQQQQQQKKEDDVYYWLVHVRHADAHAILLHTMINNNNNNTGSGSNPSGSTGQGVRRNHTTNKNNNNNNNIWNQQPCLILDELGVIVDINDYALHAKHRDNKHNNNNSTWSRWIHADLIGQHISQVSTVAETTTDTKQQQDQQQQQDASQTKKKKNTLQVIIESKFSPGHASCPGSGYLLNPQNYYENNTAMTTGNAVREENITEAAFEAALDPIFQINQHGTIQMVNTAATTVFGWRRHEFLGHNIAMICGGHGGYHAAHHGAYMARYLATGETRVIGKNRELPARRKDGSEFPIELAVVEVDTFAGDVRLFCGFVRDLTGIKARERLAQEIVEVALDPMFQIDQSGIIQMVNQAALNAFGYERSELMGQNISVICGGAHGQNHQHYLRRYARTGQAKVIGKYRELPAKRKDGSEFMIQLAVVEIQTDQKGKRMFAGFVHDLSRQRRDQDIMRGTIDTALEPVLHINENGIIQLVNNAAVQHLGYTKEELIGENVSVIVGGAHAENHGNYIERYLETGEKRAIGQKRKVTARRKDGSEMNIELGLSEIKITGSNERVFCAFLRPT